MLTFKTQIDAKFLKVQGDREIKRLVLNTAQAINETIKTVQLQERANLDRKFTIRQSGFMQRLIKINQFASGNKGIPYAEIEIDPTKARVLLGIFETGGIKRPAVGRSVAVPLTGGPARTSFGAGVTPSLQIAGLRFHARRTKDGKIQWIGANRTFIVQGVGIFQRSAGAKRLTKTQRRKRSRSNISRAGASDPNLKLIYAFENAPPLKKILGFIDIAVATTLKEFPRQFDLAYRH